MLSTKYIYNFLQENQEKINFQDFKKINSFELNDINNSITNLPDSFNVIFDKDINNFYYDDKLYKNKSLIFSLINSILLIGNEYLNLKNESDRENIIKEFLLLIDNDLFSKNLYQKFEYNKNRKFNKLNLQQTIKESIKFKTDENFNLLKKYISDYLGINLFILKIKSNYIDFDNSEYYLTTNFGDINKIVPSFIIIDINNNFKALLKNNNDLSIINYSTSKEIIDNLWAYLNIKENIDILKEEELNKDTNDANDANDTNDAKDAKDAKDVNDTNDTNEEIKFNFKDLKKLKVDELKNLCKKFNIEILKKSDKTSKMINKIKEELIEDLLKINN